jgi:hypothetical protein
MLRFAIIFALLIARPTVAATLEESWIESAKSISETLKTKNVSAIEKFALTQEGSLALLQWKFLSLLGADGRKSLEEAQPTEAKWLFTDRTALELFLTSGNAAENRWSDAARIFCQIIAKDPTAKSALPLRIAVATALVFAEPVKALADGVAIEPIARYESFHKWNDEGVLFPSFRDLNAWQMRYVVGSWATDEELAWARANIKPELKVREKIGEGAYMVEYRDVNSKGVSVQRGREYYDGRPMTMAVMDEVGGVCGAISKFGSAMCQAFGVPAMPVGQPGHCAFIWESAPHTWSIGNNISGWAQSHCHDGISIPWGRASWFVRMMSDAQQDRAAFVDAECLRIAAELAKSDVRDDVLEIVCKRSPLDFAAWQDRWTALANARPAIWRTAIKQAAEAFASEPIAFVQLSIAAAPKILGAKPTATENGKYFGQMTDQLVAMAPKCSESSLVTGALMVMLVRESQRIAPNAKSAARDIVEGTKPDKATIDTQSAQSVVDLCEQTCLKLESLNETPEEKVWRSSFRRMLRGAMLQPSSRDAGVKWAHETIERLAKSKPENDAQWLADRLVENAKETGNAEMQADATKLRQSL